jgi:hypothetical protein
VNQLSQGHTTGPSGASATSAKSTWKFLLPLIALTAIYSIGLSVLMSRRFVVPEKSNHLYFILFAALLTRWVRIDRHVRRFGVPFEFDVFVFFAWPFMVPYYLYRTRGWKGVLFGVGIWGLCIAPAIVAATVAAFLFR